MLDNLSPFLAIGAVGMLALHMGIRPPEYVDEIEKLTSAPFNETVGNEPELEVPTWEPPPQLAIADAARVNGVPYEFAMAVAMTESSLKPAATGKAGEIGLFQVKLSTAEWLGYRGTAEALYDASVNAYWGTLNLRRCLDRVGGDLHKAATCHNRGYNAQHVQSRYSEKVMAYVR